jgi:membrane protease YdiL (CAAX protease family)
MTTTQPQIAPLKPMGLLPSLLYFGIPAAITVAFVYLAIPALEGAGLSPYMAYFVALMFPLIGLFVASLIAFRIEGNPPTWSALKERFRLKPMTGRDWLWTLGLSVFGLLATGAFTYLANLLVSAGVIPLPAAIPAVLDPRLPATDLDAVARLMGGRIVGNWPVVTVYFVVLFFNIFGEEFWWRGVILPRQELAFGSKTWLVHGVLWCLFHAFKYWQYIGLLPVTLAIAFVSQRLKNNTPALIAHYIINGIGWLGVLLLVLGAGPS